MAARILCSCVRVSVYPSIYLPSVFSLSAFLSILWPVKHFQCSRKRRTYFKDLASRGETEMTAQWPHNPENCSSVFALGFETTFLQEWNKFNLEMLVDGRLQLRKMILANNPTLKLNWLSQLVEDNNDGKWKRDDFCPGGYSLYSDDRDDRRSGWNWRFGIF